MSQATDPVRVDHTDLGVARLLVDVQRLSYRIEADLTGIERIPPMHETAEELASRDDLTILACLDDGRPVALIGYHRDGSTVDIDRLAVSPTHFRQGLGRALLASVHAAEPSARRFVVSTGAGNEPAAALYRSMGYDPIGRREVEPGVSVEGFEFTP